MNFSVQMFGRPSTIFGILYYGMKSGLKAMGQESQSAQMHKKLNLSQAKQAIRCVGFTCLEAVTAYAVKHASDAVRKNHLRSSIRGPLHEFA